VQAGPAEFGLDSRETRKRRWERGNGTNTFIPCDPQNPDPGAAADAQSFEALPAGRPASLETFLDLSAQIRPAGGCAARFT
jgi:hypothetical protein